MEGFERHEIFSKPLHPCLELNIGMQFPTDLIWNSWVLTKVGFFAYEAAWRQILTLDRLKKRVWTLVNLSTFARMKKNQLFIYFCLVPKQGSYSIYYFLYLEWSGCCFLLLERFC